MASWFSSGGYLPVNTGPESRFQRASHWSLHKVTRNGPASIAIIAAALITGLIGGLVLTPSGVRSDTCLVPQASSHDPLYTQSPPTSHPLTSPSAPVSPFALGEDEELDLEALRNIVAGTRGYYARDYSMALGWNNMRYIIEASLFHGSLLNRTVIIPSFVYARSCEYPNAICAAYAPMVNRGDALNSDEWRKLPEEQQMGWRIPMSTMINITHLRRTHPVLLVSEYLRLHNLSADLEASNGQWEAEKYHQNPSVFDSSARGPPSLDVIENWWYDPHGLNRVDSIPELMKRRGDWNAAGGDKSQGEYGTWNKKEKTDIYLNLETALPKEGRQYVLEWDRTRSILQNHGIGGISSDEGLEMKLRDNGWEVLYTYDGALGMDYVKNVVNPIRQAAPRDSIRGYVEDYGHYDADVLLLKGEIHYERKPAGLRFTTTDSRDNFSRLVLFAIHPIDSVKRLSAAMDRAMTERNGGRMWMGAHMRRGDFVRYNWVMQAELGDHLQRIKTRLEHGRSVLYSMRNIGTLSAYAVPNVTVDQNQLQREVPDANDKIYLATDERDPGNLAYLSDHGAIMASDLITLEDRRRFGWPLLLTDVLGLVEQDLLARSSYFYAHALSSVAGGVVNIRAANGADPRTAKID